MGEEPEGGLLWIPDLRAPPVEERSSGVLSLAWGRRGQTEAKPQLGGAAWGNLSWTWRRVWLEQQKWVGVAVGAAPPPQAQDLRSMVWPKVLRCLFICSQILVNVCCVPGTMPSSGWVGETCSLPCRTHGQGRV